MKIETVKDLEAVAKLCRKHGIASIVIGDVTVYFNESFTEGPKKTAHTPTDDKVIDETPAYTDDDLIEWSSRGI